jgi:hypothetical protein
MPACREESECVGAQKRGSMERQAGNGGQPFYTQQVDSVQAPAEPQGPISLAMRSANNLLHLVITAGGDKPPETFHIRSQTQLEPVDSMGCVSLPSVGTSSSTISESKKIACGSCLCSVYTHGARPRDTLLLPQRNGNFLSAPSRLSTSISEVQKLINWPKFVPYAIVGRLAHHLPQLSDSQRLPSVDLLAVGPPFRGLDGRVGMIFLVLLHST